jgi:hypothetical protein
VVHGVGGCRTPEDVDDGLNGCQADGMEMMIIQLLPILGLAGASGSA